jgi:transposase-like protein
MEQRFKSLSLFEFQERYSTSEDCLKDLANLKWADGFTCRKCGHDHSCQGNAAHSRQCTKCRYVESPSAQTLFHQVKFDLLKAFYIVYFVSTNKKGITSTELSRKLNLRQKTCWSFKRKVMKGMKSSGNHPITGKAEVDETVFGGQEEGVRGRQNKKKKLVVVAIEKKKNGVSRMYAKVIDRASAKELGPFMKDHIDSKANITTDKWTGYQPLHKDFENLTQIYSGDKGGNFPELHRVIMNLKGWLRGMHHHVTDLQDYLDEYCYRFNRSFMKEKIFDNLLKRMILTEPCLIKNISD